MSNRNLLILSIVFVVISLFALLGLRNYLEKFDVEIVQFILGVLFALGLSGMYKAIKNFRKERS